MSPNRRIRPSPRTLFFAMLLYAVSFVKFFDRDPLSAQVGQQGPIELALLVTVAVTLIVAFHRHFGKLVVAPSAKAFLVFGAIAMVSSVFSFYPLLSLAKGLSFILVCTIAIVASSAYKPDRVIKYLYYSIVMILGIELAVGIVGGRPLLDIDDYSGRARLSLFGLHPTLLGELSAVTLLLGFLLSKRPPLCYQVFLFAVAIASGSRAGATLLVVILLAMLLAFVWRNLRSVALGCCLGSLFACMFVGIRVNDRPFVDIASIDRPLYGDTLARDLPTFNGRTDVWKAATPALAHSVFLGYGLGGARDVLVNNTSWDWEAGDSHNALIDLILAGGFPAVLIFLLGWAGAVRRAFRSRGSLRIAALAIYAYIVGFGIVAPNLTNLQALSTFLIIMVDAMICANVVLSPARGPLAGVAATSEDSLENPIGT